MQLLHKLYIRLVPHFIKCVELFMFTLPFSVLNKRFTKIFPHPLYLKNVGEVVVFLTND